MVAVTSWMIWPDAAACKPGLSFRCCWMRAVRGLLGMSLPAGVGVDALSGDNVNASESAPRNVLPPPVGSDTRVAESMAVGSQAVVW